MEGESGDAETGKLRWARKSDESEGDRWGRGCNHGITDERTAQQITESPYNKNARR